MSIYKRGAVWWIRYTDPNGREVRESAQTADRRQAQEYHGARKAEGWRLAKLGDRPRHGWKDAVVRWMDEHRHRMRTDEAQDYISAIRRKCLIEEYQLVKVVSGAPETGGGTWMHPKLAIRFAQWLDTDFCIWCDEQIESILRREGLNVIAQPKIHALLRAVLHDIGTTRDAFVRQGLLNQARALFAALGVPMPNIALVGKPADQMQLPV